MKIYNYLLALPLLLTACSQDEEFESNEAVTVSFSAELPKKMGTRADGTGAANAAPVDQVVCAVFNADGTTEYENLRDTITVTSSEPIKYSPQLIKGKSYKVVFWASNAGQYDVENMTTISRATEPNSTIETQFDAFTAKADITVGDNNLSQSIFLNRPLAKLNLGVTEADWKAVKELGQTPKSIKITLSASSKFNACTGTAADVPQSRTYTFPISSHNTFEKSGTTYYSLAECFVMMEAEEKNLKDVTVSIYADEACETPIRTGIFIPNCPLQNNYNTNLLGGLMTATVTYRIEFNNSFAEDDKQENI